MDLCVWGGDEGVTGPLCSLPSEATMNKSPLPVFTDQGV